MCKCGHLVYSEGAEGQRFAGVVVYQENLSIQDEIVAMLERLRNVLLEVVHLESQVSLLKVHNVLPKITFPPWLHPVKIWLHTMSR